MTFVVTINNNRKTFRVTKGDYSRTREDYIFLTASEEERRNFLNRIVKHELFYTSDKLEITKYRSCTIKTNYTTLTKEIFIVV